MVTPRSSYVVIANLEPITACVQLELLLPTFITFPLSTVNHVCCFNLQSLRIMRSCCTSARQALLLTTLNNAVASANLAGSAFALLEHHNSLHRCQNNFPWKPFLWSNPSSMLPPFQTEALLLHDSSVCPWHLWWEISLKEFWKSQCVIPAGSPSATCLSTPSKNLNLPVSHDFPLNPWWLTVIEEVAPLSHHTHSPTLRARTC